MTIFNRVEFYDSLIKLGIDEREAMFLTVEQGAKVRDEVLGSAPKSLAYVQKQGYIKHVWKFGGTYWFLTDGGLVKVKADNDLYRQFS